MRACEREIVCEEVLWVCTNMFMCVCVRVVLGVCVCARVSESIFVCVFLSVGVCISVL